jgi:hypothetical protein
VHLSGVHRELGAKKHMSDTANEMLEAMRKEREQLESEKQILRQELKQVHVCKSVHIYYEIVMHNEMLDSLTTLFLVMVNMRTNIRVLKL